MTMIEDVVAAGPAHPPAKGADRRDTGAVEGRAALRPIARLLVDSVRGLTTDPLDADVAREPIEAVLAAAGAHRIGPAVARRIRSAPGRPDDWSLPLAAQRHLQLLRHMQAGADLRRAYEALADAGVTCVVGKGPVAADLIWPAPDMREYYDVDLFVDRREFGRALIALVESGCVLVDRNWPEILRSGRAELALRGPAGTHIDLHWDIAVVPKLRRAFRVDLPAMLARSHEAALGTGARVRVFDPADTVFHLVFHAAQAGADRLMWIGDVHYAAGMPGLSWETFADRCRAARFEVPAALVLARVDRSLGFDRRPPESVLDGGPWGRWARARDAGGAFPGLPGDPRIGGRLYAGARTGVLASARETVVSACRTRVIERRVARRGPDDRVLYRDVPDAASRVAYLGAVSNPASGL